MYDEKKFDDPMKFLNEVGKLKWELKENEEWIFRGHNDATYNLIPSLYRCGEIKDYSKILRFVGDNPADANVFRNILNNFCTDFQQTLKPTYDDTQKERLCEIIERSLIDLALTEKFLKTCLQAELDVTHSHQMKYQYYDNGDPKEQVKDFLRDLVENFLSRVNKLDYPSRFYLNFINDKHDNFLYREAFPMRALSRHHGVPSRLLDWTEEPFYAAYFATYGYDFKSKKDVCVWALDSEYIKSEYVKENKAIKLHTGFTKQGLEYLKKQKGVLIELNYYDACYYLHGKWALFHEYLDYNDIESKKALKCFVLNSSAVSKLEAILAKKNIHKHNLMPSYDNVGEYTKNYFTKKSRCSFVASFLAFMSWIRL